MQSKKLNITKQQILRVIKYLFALNCIFGIINGYAQTNDGFFLGKIVNENNEPISNVNVLNITDSTGTTSNTDGLFFFKSVNFPLFLKLSYIGFEGKILTVSEQDYKTKIKNYYKIVLSKKTFTLQEVEIFGKNDKNIFQSSFGNILLDYEILDNNIITLLRDGSKRKIRIINRYSGNWFDIVLTIKANEIYKDCIGNLHLLTNDSIYQIKVYLQDSTITLYHPYSLNKFQQTLSKCVGFLNEKFIFSTYHLHNQEINYWSVNNHKTINLRKIFNKERFLFAQNLLDRVNELKNKYGHINEMGDITVNQLQIMRKISQLNYTYQFIGKIPAYNPLFIFNDTVVVFNHVTDSIFFFDKNFLLIKKDHIKYRIKNLQKILLDDITHTFYLVYQNNGILSIYKFNINIGKRINNTIRINSIFPQKIKIYDNSIYYIDNDRLLNKKTLKRHIIK